MEKKLKVLFVASGNSRNFEIAPFIKAQGESLIRQGIVLDYFSIAGKGLTGYLKGARQLRTYLKENDYDVIHAHYALSGWSAVLSFPKQPIVLSLMGTDAYGEYIGVNKIKFTSRYLILLTKLIQPFVSGIICKSKHIESFVYLKKKSSVIPNGILLESFNVHQENFRKELNLEPSIKYVLFLGNKTSIRKNYSLAEAAIEKLNDSNVRLIAPFPISHSEVVKYLNSVDCVIVPSLMEGSPNVVKEAMACNCPVLTTDVGDAKWVLGDTEGCFITSFEPEEVAEKLRLALQFAKAKGRTNGRDRIMKLGLDSETVANRIVTIYNKVLEKHK